MMTAEINTDDLPALTAADVMAAFDLNDAGEWSLEAFANPSTAPVSIFAISSAQDAAIEMVAPQVQIATDLLNMIDSAVADLDMGHHDIADHSIDQHHMPDDAGFAM